MARDFQVTVIDSSREFTKRELVQLKDTNSMNKLDQLTKTEPVVISPVDWAVLQIHNGNAKEGQSKDFENYVVFDTDGNKYVTGSQSFWGSFRDIFDEMKDEPEWDITIERRPSRNFKDKDFLTCVLN